MIITLTGDNSFALQVELKKLVDSFVQKNGAMGLEKIDTEEADYQKIYDALTSLPFLASKKLVVLRRPSASKEFTERIEALLKKLPETTDLVLVEPKFDKRSSIYKLLKKITDFKEFNELDENDLASWVAETAKSKSCEISLADARFLVERIGTNQQLLASELEKILLYDSKITRQNIELLSEPTMQSTIFELLDAAFAGNAKKAIKLYGEQRQMKVESQQIIAMLAWQLHILALIKTADERSPQQIASDAKLNPFVVRKSQNIARDLTLPRLKSQISNLLKLDVRLKTESIDADEAVKYYLLNLSKNSR